MAYISGSLVDPPATSSIAQAVAWIEGTALGTLASVVAVIAVAAIGLAMLSGRLDLRRGATVVLGCFLIFGARSIGTAVGGGSGETTVSLPALQTSPSLPLPATPPTPPYDPYAGASVPS